MEWGANGGDNMKKAWFVIVVAALIAAGNAYAAPKNGFGVNIGASSQSMDGSLKAQYGGYDVSYTSSGLSLGADYQIALSDTFSLNPFLMSSSENTSGDLKSGTTVGHGILGLQLRHWLDDFFIGGQIARYTEALVYDGGSTTTGAGTGFGIAAGWEKADGGLFILCQLDKASLAYSDADVNLTGFRLSVGYRWK